VGVTRRVELRDLHEHQLQILEQRPQPLILARWRVEHETRRAEEIARLAKNGPTAEEVDRAKTKWEYNFVTGLERIGGFGGADGLADFLRAQNIDAVIDATHPYAPRISANAVVACARARTPGPAGSVSTIRWGTNTVDVHATR